MNPAEIAAAAAGCFAMGFSAGVAYTARRIPHILARTSQEQIRLLARQTARLRKDTAG